jgi:hypothetical protein
MRASFRTIMFRQIVGRAATGADTVQDRIQQPRVAGGNGSHITPEHCPARVGNTLVYFHRGHIALENSRLLAPVLGALADRALIRRWPMMPLGVAQPSSRDWPGR